MLNNLTRVSRVHSSKPRTSTLDQFISWHALPRDSAGLEIAVECLREAIERRLTSTGPGDSRVSRWLVLLEGRLVALGDLTSAFEVRTRRQQMYISESDF